jgi:hypothetical protein
MKKSWISVLLVPLLLAAVTVTGTATSSRADSGARGEALSRATGRGGGDLVARAAGRGGATYSRGYSRGGYGYGGHSYGGHRHGGGHFSGSIYIGPGWGYWDPFFYPYYYTYPAYPYYTPPTVVVPQEPQEYISPNTKSEEEQSGYWYYCRKPEGYYPYVERCPNGWMKVLPNTTPPEQQDDEEE